MSMKFSKKLMETLHEEFHEAEERALKKLGIKEISQGARILGAGTYISCCALSYLSDEEEGKDDSHE